MPKVSRTAHEQDIAGPFSGLDQYLQSMPVLHVGVNRKANIGNFENIDIYSAISLPLKDVDGETIDELRKIIEAVAEFGFDMMSELTAQKYETIKGLQSGGR